ncbi:RCC1 repeat-containing isoform A [Chlorella sorokiniana]|uniref:RCC1 repeat-containing isoform A n=1 Tax=Chlorella sorokiniana TaxID=3076 RepID=A0A2P6TNM4_CHLSO|nr:RCC1 repeat-containing isoform B [Chlorella sorokiniana]PRW50925.1 RCC1 repeat-containing isoform A [Chlorella sorokiniana]|eukprot:PRW50924.1 RCC1 repeat-containing isoform B [Chlorella sorokiniana]
MATKRLLLGVLCSLLFLLDNTIRAKNETWCWGDGGFGQLGNGEGDADDTTNDDLFIYSSTSPVQVLGDQSFATVCTGWYHSCALEPPGKAWCWGSNRNGQLGTGASSNSTVPVEVAGGRAFRSISCGLEHTCALDFEGQAWCWGWNSNGQLGTGDKLNSNLRLVQRLCH